MRKSYCKKCGKFLPLALQNVGIEECSECRGIEKVTYVTPLPMLNLGPSGKVPKCIYPRPEN